MTTQVNSENITLHENKLDTKGSGNVYNRQIHRDRKQMTSFQELRRGSHEVCMSTKGTRFLWGDENEIVVMIVQAGKDPKNHGTVHIKKMIL